MKTDSTRSLWVGGLALMSGRSRRPVRRARRCRSWQMLTFLFRAGRCADACPSVEVDLLESEVDAGQAVTLVRI